jgi:hypothetical protein
MWCSCCCCLMFLLCAAAANLAHKQAHSHYNTGWAIIIIVNIRVEHAVAHSETYKSTYTHKQAPLAHLQPGARPSPPLLYFQLSSRSPATLYKWCTLRPPGKQISFSSPTLRIIFEQIKAVIGGGGGAMWAKRESSFTEKIKPSEREVNQFACCRTEEEACVSLLRCWCFIGRALTHCATLNAFDHAN